MSSAMFSSGASIYDYTLKSIDGKAVPLADLHSVLDAVAVRGEAARRSGLDATSAT